MPVTTASAGTSPGVVLRLEGVASVPEAAGQTAPALTQASMLPQLLNPDVLNNATFLASSCSGFKAFRAIKISSCSVPDVKALHWRVLGGSWRWRWPQPPGLSSSDSIECPEGLFLYKL